MLNLWKNSLISQYFVSYYLLVPIDNCNDLGQDISFNDLVYVGYCQVTIVLGELKFKKNPFAV